MDQIPFLEKLPPRFAARLSDSPDPCVTAILIKGLIMQDESEETVVLEVEVRVEYETLEWRIKVEEPEKDSD